MIKRELKNVKVGDLIPYEANPRRNNKSAKIVAKSRSFLYDHFIEGEDEELEVINENDKEIE